MEGRDSLIGQTVLGNYVVEHPIGRGAMGSIYQARHKVLGRKVAVKVLRTNLRADPDEHQRFHAEAETIARLSHPNVVTILDFGTTQDGAPCIVTEFINGETISDILDAEGPIEPWRATKLIQQVLSALIEAHTMGIVHRDIKCDNIMVQRLQDGREQVKLVDFGISIMEGRKNTDSGYIFGTPLYMCPEQCRGELPDGRGDLYSLGVVFFEMLTGEPLFYFDNPYDYLNAHVSTQPPRPTDVADQPIPEALEEIILKLLAKAPTDRYQSAQEVKQALHQWEVSRKSTDKGIEPATMRSARAETPTRGNSRGSMDSSGKLASARVTAEHHQWTAAILHPDPDMSAALGNALKKLGFEAARFEAPIQLRKALRAAENFDVYLLFPPDPASGLTPMVTEILLADPLAEVLILTETAAVREFPDGLQWAVSDFLIRPDTNFRTFAGRIKAAARRREANLLQAESIKEAMRALNHEDLVMHPLAEELQAMMERLIQEPPRLVAWVSDPAKRALQRHGHIIHPVPSLEDLPHLLAKRGLDAVVVETSVTNMSPTEVTSQVVSRRPDLELVLAGFRNELSDLLESVELGATDLVIKPIEDLDVFCLKVELAVARRRRRLRIRRLLRTIEALQTSTEGHLHRRLEQVRKALTETLVMEAAPPGGPHSPLERLDASPLALVAEPDPMVASLLAKVVESMGWTVQQTASMAEAIERIRKEQLDVVFLAADGSGWSSKILVRELAEHRPRTPVILLGKESFDQQSLPLLQQAATLAKPLAGMGAIRRAADRALCQRRRLVQMETINARGHIRVLLVEPRDDDRSQITTLLTNNRCAVVSAKDLKEAAHLVERFDIDVAVIPADVLLAATGMSVERIRTIESMTPILCYGTPKNRTSVLTILTLGARSVVASPLVDEAAFFQGLTEILGNPDQLSGTVGDGASIP